jgi:flagellin-like hook-associated protein FlgL
MISYRGVLIGALAFFVCMMQPIGLWANPSVTYLNHILKESENQIDKNYKRLSGGIKLLIDDPANYAIYEKLETNVRALGKEIENNNDVISYYGFGESILGNIIDALQRIRELLVEKTNTIFSKEDLDLFDSEIRMQYDQIIFVLDSAEFNKIRVFGDFFKDKTVRKIFERDPFYSIAVVDRMLDFITYERSYYGALVNQLEHRIKTEMQGRENYESTQSTIIDIDYGKELSRLAVNHILLIANILLLPMK